MYIIALAIGEYTYMPSPLSGEYSSQIKILGDPGLTKHMTISASHVIISCIGEARQTWVEYFFTQKHNFMGRPEFKRNIFMSDHEWDALLLQP